MGLAALIPGDIDCGGLRLSSLELAAVTKAYGDAIAVNCIDHIFRSGTYSCLLGPSGCGKSSTLRMIAGHELATEGDIILGGRNITDLPPAQRGTAMMFQSYALFPHLSVVDNVAFSLKMKGVDKPTRRTRAMELLELVDMTGFSDRLPSQLSGGQQQRVFLARALMQDADLYLMDEPFAAVDAATEEAIVELLRKLSDRGKTCLVVHHDLATVTTYFDWLVLINMRVVADGPSGETFTRENLQKTYGGKLNLLEKAAEALRSTPL